MLPPPPDTTLKKSKKVNFTLEQAFKVQRGVQVYTFFNFISLKSNPSNYIRVMWRSVPWNMWEAVTGVQGTPC
jgi:hypothetical protein